MKIEITEAMRIRLNMRLRTIAMMLLLIAIATAHFLYYNRYTLFPSFPTSTTISYSSGNSSREDLKQLEIIRHATRRDSATGLYEEKVKCVIFDGEKFNTCALGSDGMVLAWYGDDYYFSSLPDVTPERDAQIEWEFAVVKFGETPYIGAIKRSNGKVVFALNYTPFSLMR